MSNSATPWIVVCQLPLSMGFPREEFWSGLPFPSPGDLPAPGIELWSPVLQADPLPLSYQGSPGPTDLWNLCPDLWLLFPGHSLPWPCRSWLSNLDGVRKKLVSFTVSVLHSWENWVFTGAFSFSPMGEMWDKEESSHLAVLFRGESFTDKVNLFLLSSSVLPIIFFFAQMVC